MKKLTAVLLVIALCFGLAACSKKEAAAEPASVEPEASASATALPAAAAPVEEPAAEPENIGALPAATLGSYTVTCAEVKNEYDYFVSYMTYYGMEAPSTEADKLSYMDMVVDNSILNLTAAWKAEEEGITLTDEDMKDVAAQVDQHRQEILESYDEHAREEAGENATAEEIEAVRMRLIENDVMDYMGIDFTTYLSQFEDQYKQEKLTEKLKAKVSESVTVSDEEAKAAFDAALAADKAAVAADPLAYMTAENDYNAKNREFPALVVPEGLVRAQIITLKLSDEDKQAFTAYSGEKEKLEAEYGKLALNGGSEERMEEIRARYAQLSELLLPFLEKLNGQAREVYDRALTENIFFGALMQQCGETDTEIMEKGTVISTVNDSLYPEAVLKTLGTMQDGEIAEPVLADGNYYIIRCMNVIPAAETAFEDVKDIAAAKALADKKDAEWETLYAEWETAAGLAAVRYPENYKQIIS